MRSPAPCERRGESRSRGREPRPGLSNRGPEATVHVAASGVWTLMESRAGGCTERHRTRGTGHAVQVCRPQTCPQARGPCLRGEHSHTRRLWGMKPVDWCSICPKLRASQTPTSHPNKSLTSAFIQQHSGLVLGQSAPALTPTAMSLWNMFQEGF